MAKKSNTNGKSNAELFEQAAVEQGMANVAANNAAVESAPVEEAKKRGRKPSNTMTLAKFTAHVKASLADGEGITFVQGGVKVNDKGIPTIEPSVHTSVPVLALDENGALTITQYTARNLGHVTANVLAGPVPAEIVLEFVKNYKPAPIA